MATYSYAASSGAVVRIAGVSSTTDSAVDATGSRLATKTSTALFGWTLPDLHGDVAGALSSSGSTITDAFRYDAYGETIDKATSSLPTPWRYQGRLLENEAGDADLYDFGFRRYAADLARSTASTISRGVRRTRSASTASCTRTPIPRP